MIHERPKSEIWRLKKHIYISNGCWALYNIIPTSGSNETQRYFGFSLHTDTSLSQVTEVKGGLLVSSWPHLFSGSFQSREGCKRAFTPMPFQPKRSLSDPWAAFACFNVVTALFAFPAKAWPHINSLPSSVWEITCPWIPRASCKINHIFCIFCIAVEIMVFYGTRML